MQNSRYRGPQSAPVFGFNFVIMAHETDHAGILDNSERHEIIDVEYEECAPSPSCGPSEVLKLEAWVNPNADRML